MDANVVLDGHLHQGQRGHPQNFLGHGVDKMRNVGCGIGNQRRLHHEHALWSQTKATETGQKNFKKCINK